MFRFWAMSGPEQDALTPTDSNSTRVSPTMVARLRGNGNAAILLTVLIAQGRRTKDQYGWFAVTQEKLKQLTGLGPDGQLSARRLLVRLGYIEETREGLPAVLFYRVDFTKALELVPERRQ